MADKTPVRVVFNASNVATGMAEFQSGETVPVANGGTGLGAIGSAGQIIKVNAAGNALEFGAEGDISITNLVAPTNADLTLTTSGTGGIILNDISISDNAISTNRTNDDFKINASGTGTVNLENLKVGTGGATVTTILDEDAMGSDSATSLATQQSIKAYADTKAVLSGSTNNQITTVTGAHAIQGESNLTFDGSTLAVTGAVTVSGDLTVSGDTTTVSTTNTAISDNILELNTGISQSFNDAGIIIERGSTGNNAAIIWDESADTFVLGTTTATAGDKSGGITIDAGSLKIASLEVDGVTITDNVITSNSSNSDLEINANGSGSVVTDSDVTLANDKKVIFGDAGENIVGDGTDLAINSSRNITLDADSAINLDGDSNGTVNFKDGGAKYFVVQKSSSSAVLSVDATDGDMIFKGDDGGSVITALTLDMSAAGAATFNAGVTATTGTFSGNVAISGDLTVSGDTATVSTTNTTIADNIIELNTGISQSLNDAGIIIERGSTGNNAAIIWDESADTFVLGTTTATAADKSGGITIDAGSLKIASLEVDGVTITDNVITSNSSNANLEINANGSGSVVIGQVSTNSVTGEVIPGKVGGTNFTDSLLIGHATTGTLDSAEANTGVGIGTLDALTSGDRNTALGHDAGTGITTANNNTLIGYEAGKGITNANQNTVIGDSAFAGSNPESSSASNTVVGAFAMNVSSGAKENTAIGRDAGREVTSGDSNIFIGYNAGANDSTSGITTGSGNVIIGTVDPDSRTGDRQLKIAGYDGSTTTTWIAGDSSGNLTTVGDVTLANNKKVIFGDAGESISGDGTDLTINSSGDVIMKLTGEQLILHDGTSNIAQFDLTSNHLTVATLGNDKDMFFKGVTGASQFTALTLDMSAAGAATFNDKIILGTNKEIQFVDTNESIKSDGSKMIIKSGGTTFNLPTADGTAGQALVTDGSGTLSFDSVATTVSDDGLATVKSNKHLGSTARTLDSINATFIDSAFYFFVHNDIVNETISAEMFAVTNNDTASFLGNRRGIESSGGDNVPTLATDISNGQYRVRVTGTSADCRGSFYKVAMSSSTTDATRGNTVTSSNTDVDSASESVDTFAHATFRGAKYFISVDNDSKTEMEVVEALVVHDGTNAFISQYGHTTSGNNSLVTLTAAISGDNVVVSAAGLETNLNLTMHKILLKDNMTAQSNANQKAFAAVTVSSSATAIDLMDIDEANGAVHFIVGANASEGAYSIQEVYTAATPGVPAVANGPFVSTKGTSQLEFTAAFDTSSENSLELFASSTSGGSTTVSGYRISALAG